MASFLYSIQKREEENTFGLMKSSVAIYNLFLPIDLFPVIAIVIVIVIDGWLVRTAQLCDGGRVGTSMWMADVSWSLAGASSLMVKGEAKEVWKNERTTHKRSKFCKNYIFTGVSHKL